MTVNIEHIDDIYSLSRISDSYSVTALNYLLKIAESEGIEVISGRLITFQKNYYDNLKNFFFKNGFKIDYSEEEKEITISKEVK